MNLFFILLLIALIVAGYYVYQRLITIEHEIRAEQRSRIDPEDSPSADVKIESSASEPESKVDDSGAQGEEPGVKEQIRLAVEETPGLAQTELYAKFPDQDRRELQKLLRELDQSGQLRRDKKGSSYRLYPL